MTALLAFLTNPHIQSRAQDEIDNVVTRTRLPTFDDRSHLPYVGAVVREVFRWHHAIPLSVTRVAGTDDIYDGMFIPKGAQIIPNLWAMTHDSRIYAEPHVFKPERFLLQNGNLNDDESKTSFGFGRRICPGQDLAEATVWITIASFLVVYRISPAKDVEGNDIPVEIAFSDGIASYPHPFESSIVPHDAEAEGLLKSFGKASE
ncbi:hypothetical protein EWM64_g6046 [Hericium alpestre]|uniref:Cytochrome P450 n=1 Tax=Hericium alpestre TaxID=135208 RepID=A0A4Y9ZTR2_9AGAM|nr:hypothetical protein EWM64_g6046 [Hericium alpestre]